MLVLASLPQAQGTAPATPLTLLTRDARRPIATTVLNGQEFIGLDEVASIFQVMVREDAVAHGVSITYKGRTVVASTEQPMASVNGRVVTLPAPVARAGSRLLVPIDFLTRALAPVYDQPIDFRRASRLLIVGAFRIPHVVARIDAPGPPTRVTVEVTPALAVSPAVDGARVLLRVDADALDMVPPPPTSGLVDQIRVGDQTTTVAIALNARAGMPRISTTVAADATRVTIDVPLAAPQETQVPQPALPAAPTPPASPAPPALPGPGEGAALQTMVIDPGHGGDDNGVRGAKGTLEKQITLDVATKLKTLIETRMGVRVVMTRSDDRTVAPDERDAIANNSKADLFLSLHVNGAPAASVTGAQVYYLRLDRAGEEARKSAAASELVLPTINGGTRPIDVIPWDLAQAEHIEASSRFATILQQELQKHAPMAAKPLQQEPMRVLSGVNMPAALVEMAYLTNAGQEQDVQSADFQNGIAQAMYDAVARFRDTGFPKP